MGLGEFVHLSNDNFPEFFENGSGRRRSGNNVHNRRLNHALKLFSFGGFTSS